MSSNSKPGSITLLGRIVFTAAIIGLIAGALALYAVYRPKANPAEAQVIPQQPPPQARSEVPPQAKQEEAPRAETPRVQTGAPPVQQPAVGSDDPYGNLSTKEKK